MTHGAAQFSRPVLPVGAGPDLIRVGPGPRALRAAVSVPGSKYEANRLLIAAALTDGETRLSGLPDNEDIAAAVAAIRALGCRVRAEAETLVIRGLPTEEGDGDDPVTVDVGESGTLFRFLTATAATVPRPVTIRGRGRIHERPILGLVRALEALGGRIQTTGGFAPLAVSSGTLAGGRVRIAAAETSQFASALLLAAPRSRASLAVEVVGPAASTSYLDLTVRVMERCGVRVERDEGPRFRVPAGSRYRPGARRVSGDWTTATYFLAAAALGSGPDGAPGHVEVGGLDPDSPQGERRFPALLRRMGCKVVEETGESGFRVRVTGTDSLLGADLDMGSLPDAVPTLAALAPFAHTPTRITGIAHLRLKESDRIEALAAGLRALGAGVETGDDSLTIQPSRMQGGVIEPEGDHRIAMGLALIGLRIPGVRVRSPGVVSKSFPGFWTALGGLGASVVGEGAVP